MSRILRKQVRKLIVVLLLMISPYIEAMSWKLSNSQNKSYTVSFLPDENSDKIVLMVTCDRFSLIELSEENQKLFKKINEMFVYSNFEDVFEYINSSDNSEVVSDIDRLVCNGNPKKISVKELSKIIKTKKVIFYTGAGISAGSVPTMDELMKDLGISENLKKESNLQKYIADIIKYPKPYIEVLRNFFDKCQNAAPSRAHAVISEIISKQNQLLVTENLDQLHQKTGLMPVVLAGCDVYSKDENIKSALIKADFVIAIGLNSDESGFLKFYKKLNPEGKIISINLKNTDYLSDNDLLIVGDVQNLFDKLVSLVIK